MTKTQTEPECSNTRPDTDSVENPSCPQCPICSVNTMNPEPFPTFSFKKITVRECRSLNTGSCVNVALHSSECVNDSLIWINCAGTNDEITRISSKIRSLNRSRPVYFELLDQQTVAKVFAPIRTMVVVIRIFYCQSSLTTSKLPNLEIVNLLVFELFSCNGIVIHKKDFVKNLRLRDIVFEQVTIGNMEFGTFTNLPELQSLTIEFYWTQPFTTEFLAHLQRFHCDCKYSWFRRWLKQNIVVISPKKYGKMYHIGKFWAESNNAVCTRLFVQPKI